MLDGWDVAERSVAIVGSMFTILFGFLSVYFYQQSKKEKEPCYAIRTLPLVQDRTTLIEDIQVLYRGSPVPNLAVSKVVFWNRGRSTIDRTDVVEGHRLRVTGINQARVLGARVLAANNPANGIEIEVLDDAAGIRFEYLDYGHGAVFQVVHTGTKSGDLHFDGVLKGAPVIRRLLRPLRRTRWDRLSDRALMIIPIFLGLLLIFYGSVDLLIERSDWTGEVMGAGMGLLGVSISVGLYLTLVRSSAPGEVLPSGLEIFLGESFG